MAGFVQTSQFKKTKALSMFTIPTLSIKGKRN
jgi:hypothetical protein